MATYKQIFGSAVQNYTTNPDNPIEGQLWYDSTNGSFKYNQLELGAWTTGGDLGTGRYNMGGFGDKDAGLVTGGRAGTPRVAVTESYNGTSWTEVNDLNLARMDDGSAGIQTAALQFGGTPGTTVTSSWNGTSWSDVPATLNTGRFSGGGTGLQSAALQIGGATPSATAVVELYNGTSWTEVNDLNTAVAANTAGGTSTSAVSFGGSSTVARTESWNGTCWTEAADLLTGANSIGGDGSSNLSAFAAGGNPGNRVTTQEWTGGFVPVTKTITAS